MAFSIQHTLEVAADQLQDEGHVRWPIPTLIRYANDALVEIASKYHSATAVVQPIRLVRGTQQILPERATNMIECYCNLVIDNTKNGPEFYQRGSQVTPVSRTVLDQQVPNWQSDSVIPYSRTVQNIVDDPSSPRNYLVFPGNDGGGRLEVLVSRRPDMIRLMDPVADPELIASWQGISVDLDSRYLNGFLEFILSRAYGSDIDVPNAMNRSETHMQRFMSAFQDPEIVDVARTPQRAESVAVATEG